MKRLSLCLLLCVCMSPATAHHSRSAFELDRTVEITGVITEVAWRNPHVYVVLDGKSEDGRAGEWTLEGHSISGLIGLGWNADSIKVGDSLIATVNPTTRPSFVGLIDHLGYADGRAFYAFRAPPAEADTEEVRARAEVIPSTDFSGNWSFTRSLRSVLLFSTPNFDSYPLTATGASLAAQFDPDDSPAFRCEERGIPWLTASAYQQRWIRYDDRIVIEKQQSDRDMIRTVYLDGRSMPEDFQPSPIGFSTGYFDEEGRLVVETQGFVDTAWGLVTGIDSSAQKQMTERYQLVNGGVRMIFEYEVTDPVYATEAIAARGVYDKFPEAEFVWEACDIEAATRHSEVE